MDKFKALHLSDLHNKPECIARLKFIAEHYPKHILLITGDLTEDGKDEQYIWILDQLSRAHVDYIVVPGNHDWAGAGNFDRQCKADEFDETFGAQFATVGMSTTYLTDNLVIFGLNSNPGTFGWFLDFATGKIGKQQLRLLEEDLGRYRTYTRIVLLHHHLQDPDITGWRRWWHKITRRLMELSNSKQLCKILKGRCDIVLHGHRHSQYDYDVDGIPVYCAGALYEQTEALEIIIENGVISTRYVRII